MKACPKCGCGFHKIAYRIGPVTVAVACMACEFCGPEVKGNDPRALDRAAQEWDCEAVRLALPAFLRKRLPHAPDYVKPAPEITLH
jgi:hypothetical protein